MEGEDSVNNRESSIQGLLKKRKIEVLNVPGSASHAHDKKSSAQRGDGAAGLRFLLPLCSIPQAGYPLELSGESPTRFPVGGISGSVFLGSEEMAIRQCEERIIRQRLADASSAMNQLAMSQAELAANRSLEQLSLPVSPLGIESLYSHMIQPSRNDYRLSSLGRLELERYQLLRHIMVEQAVASSGLSRQVDLGHLRNVPCVATFQSRDSHGLVGSVDNYGGIPRANFARGKLPTMNDLSSSDHARILAVNDILSRENEASRILRLQTTNSTQPTSSMVLGTYSVPPRHSSVASRISGNSDSMVGTSSIGSWNLFSGMDLTPQSCTDSHQHFSTAEDDVVDQGSSIKHAAAAQKHGASPELSLAQRLPMPKEDDLMYKTPHFMERYIVPLASDEDQNWLSEMLCFVRSDIVEVFRATDEDIRSRNSCKRVRLGQVGIRCRFCAHLSRGSRTGRAASFPSSLNRIYQSLTMMLRDHFALCFGMPVEIREKFIRLKCKTTQGATDSKLFWVHSAKRMGLIDSEEGGIWIRDDEESSEFDFVNDYGKMPPTIGKSKSKTARIISSKEKNPEIVTLSAQRRLSVSSSSLSTNDADITISREKSSSTISELVATASSFQVASEIRPEARSSCPIVDSRDHGIITPFLFKLLSQANLVQLEESERVGNRKTLPEGLPGLSCCHCEKMGRRGLCRVFPARRRTLQAKVYDLYDHIMKCTLCPDEIKKELTWLKQTEDTDKKKVQRGERAFFNELWLRMGNRNGS